MSKYFDEKIEKLVTGLKIEHYDIMHKHGYADFKLDEPIDEAYDKDEEWLSDIYEAAVAKLVEEARIKGIIEALEGVGQQHYGYKGELVVDTYLSLTDRLRPKGEDPAFSLPVAEAIEFYKKKLEDE